MHFIGLVNVVNLKAGGSARSAPSSSNGSRSDVKRLKSSTPIVVFAHIPLWSVYPEWGWGTDDSARALSYLKRFGSVSVLNGHIHQVMQKVEGHVTFHTAMSTAFPQPAPGSAPSPGPMKVADDRLRKVLGLSRMSFHDVNHPIAITDVPLEDETAAAGAHDVVVDNFSFAPATTSRAIGSDRSPGPTATMCRTTSSARSGSSSRRCSTPTSSSRTASTRRARIGTSARFIRG